MLVSDEYIILHRVPLVITFATSKFKWLFAT